MTRNVLCIKWGTKYGSEYVNNLYLGTKKYSNFPFRFVCLTENTEGIHPDIDIYPLPKTPFNEASFDARKGGATWRKVGLLQPGLADLEGDTLFLDLDVVITGTLEPFFSFQPGKFCVIHDWLEKRRAWLPGRDGRVGNTSVFRFNSNLHRSAYDYFAEHQEEVLRKFRIEQQYVSYALRHDLCFWPEQWVCSFKRSCRPIFPLNHFCTPQKPKGMHILVFHGYPLPDQAITGYRAGIIKSTLPAQWIADDWTCESAVA